MFTKGALLPRTILVLRGACLLTTPWNWYERNSLFSFQSSLFRENFFSLTSSRKAVSLKFLKSLYTTFFSGRQVVCAFMKVDVKRRTSLIFVSVVLVNWNECSLFVRIKPIHSFLYKDNFIRTKALILAGDLRTN